MLLRRIRHHIVNENWFAVFVDFVIVVVGVYVGIEVSNWNESRQEEALSHEYLERIRADLLHDRDAADSRVRFWARVREYGDGAIAYAETGELVRGSVADTVLAFYQASQVDPYSAVSTTYDELKAAGELRLIRDGELRTKLADYYVYSTNLQAEHLFQFMPKYREYVRGAMPKKVQAYVWENCHVADNNDQRLLDCELPVTDAEGRAILEALVADQSVVNSLRFWIVNLGVASMLIDDNMVLTGELLRLVDANLGQAD